jgi:hypothetical protein
VLPPPPSFVSLRKSKWTSRGWFIYAIRASSEELVICLKPS